MLEENNGKIIQTRITNLIIGGMTCHVMGRNIGDKIDDGDFWDVQTRNFNDNHRFSLMCLKVALQATSKHVFSNIIKVSIIKDNGIIIF
jgi:hypothetical protein